MDIEAQRLENLRQKQKLLAELNLHATTSTKHKKDLGESTRVATAPPKKKRKVEGTQIHLTPSRTSARIASTGSRPSYKEDNGDRYNYVEGRGVATKAKRRIKVENTGTNGLDDTTYEDHDSLIPSKDVDEIVAGWSVWTPSVVAETDSPLRDEVDGTYHFSGFPTFLPNKSPEEMIREGAFGGSYFRPLRLRKLPGVTIQDDWKEIPASWLVDLDVDRFLTSPDYDPDVNKFKVACGQSIEEWEAAGWLRHEFDPRGWFQWYIRFWLGRRCDDDERQIGRWERCVGKRGRWKRLLLKKYVKMGVKEVFDDGEEEEEVSPVMHQTCHHWAYEVRQGDLDEAWAEFR